MNPRYPHVFITRKDNGWVYSLQTSASSESEGVHVDGTPLVLKLWAPSVGDGKDFTLTLEEDK